MVDSKRVYKIVKLMLSKVEDLESISDKKKVEKGKGEILRLQKMLADELK